MRRLHLLVALALAVSACEADAPGPGATGEPTASDPPTVTTPASPPPSASPSATPTPTPTPAEVRLPSDTPGTVDDPAAIVAIAAGDLSPLAPPGAEIGFREARDEPLEEVALTWHRGADPFAQEHGFVLWQRLDGTWVAVYAFTDRPAKGVLGISVQVGELTGDAFGEYLTFEQTGGSGACGTWRVMVPSPGSALEAFRRATCDAEVRIVSGMLEVREAVYEPDDPHCCPSAFRISRLLWDGETAFVLVSSEETPTGG